MAITVKHKYVSAVPDSGDTNVVQPSNWNDDHQLTGTVPVANGGTGASTLTGYVKGNGTSAMTAATTIPNTDITGLGTASTKDAGVANGVATLDSSGQVPLSQIPPLGDLNYQGTWNASTNSPTLVSSSGTKGYYYVVSVAGSTNLNGITDWQIGDWAVFNGTVWQKIDNTDAVTSVNGYTGAVVLGYADVGAANSGTNTNITSMTGITGGISSPDYIAFDTTYSTTLTAGQLGWDGNNTLAIGMAGGNVIQHIGEDSFFYIKASSAITKGQLVMFTGAVGASGVLTGAPSTGVTNPSYIMGVAAETIALNGFGLVQCFGELTNVNTNGFNEGDILYYDSAVTGGLTSTYPTSGPIVQVAAVAKKSAGGGVIYIRVSVTQRVTAGTGVSVSQNGTGVTVTNSAPDQTVAIASGTGISVTGTYPNFTVTNTSPSSGGTVTNVSGTAPISVANGTTTPAISISQANTSTNGYLSSTDWNTFNNKGSGSVTSVSGTGTVSGISLSGTVTSSGNLTLGGALDLSAPPAIGGTTPNTGTFTTLTAQTEVLKGTGQNYLLQSQALGTSPWANTFVSATNNTTTAPDGTSTASTISGDGSSNFHFSTQATSASLVLATLSIYLKYNNNQYVFLQTRDSSGSNGTNAIIDIQNGVLGTVSNTGTATGASATISSVGNGWYRCTLFCNLASSSTFSFRIGLTNSSSSINSFATSNSFYAWGAQLELSSTVGTYIPTTTTAVYGTPSLSFSGVAGLGLQSDGSLYVSPAGTGAIQAQATTSSATGGNARGANAVDWQTLRSAAGQVASGTGAFIGGGSYNTSNGYYSSTVGGNGNTSGNVYSFIGGGASNSGNQYYSTVVGGYLNSSTGYYNFIGAGFTNSGTATSAVTTQATSSITSGSTAVTLSGSNASIKVGQYITGTPIANDTYVAAISGTSLTLSKNATSSTNATLSFYTPHGVVVGGGNNQATGSYSFIGGGGDAGTAANRNVASGDWSTVAGGRNNTASGIASFVGGGGFDGANALANTASGIGASVIGGVSNTASGNYSTVGGRGNSSDGSRSTVFGAFGTSRGLVGNIILSANNIPISATVGASQSALLILGRQTTDATPTVLASDVNAAGTTNQVILPNNSAYYFKGTIIAGVTGAGNTSAWTFEGAIKRGANAASTAIVGTVTTTLVAQDAGASTWAIAIAADTTNGGLKVTVTGQASTTIRWVSQIQTTEMTF